MDTRVCGERVRIQVRPVRVLFVCVGCLADAELAFDGNDGAAGLLIPKFE